MLEQQSASLVPVKWAETMKTLNGHNSLLQWCIDLKLKSNIASYIDAYEKNILKECITGSSWRPGQAFMQEELTLSKRQQHWIFVFCLEK